jgi:hypothetical protein
MAMIEKMVRGPVLGGPKASPEEEVQRWGGSAVRDVLLLLSDLTGQQRRFRCHRRPQGEFVYNTVVSPGEDLR